MSGRQNAPAKLGYYEAVLSAHGRPEIETLYPPHAPLTPADLTAICFNRYRTVSLIQPRRRIAITHPPVASPSNRIPRRPKIYHFTSPSPTTRQISRKVRPARPMAVPRPYTVPVSFGRNSMAAAREVSTREPWSSSRSTTSPHFTTNFYNVWQKPVSSVTPPLYKRPSRIWNHGRRHVWAVTNSPFWEQS